MRRHETPENAAAIRRYWDAAPETFVVARDAAGELSGYYFLFVPRDVSPRVLDADPRGEPRGASTCARTRCPHGQIALFIREWGTLRRRARDAARRAEHLPRHQAHLPRAAAGARPRLRPRARPRRAGRAARGARLHARAPGSTRGSARDTVHTLFADFGPGSFDGWLADLGARELHLEADTVLDVEQRRLVLDGRASGSRGRELGVLDHLHAREGRVVSREELFRDVWGTSWTGDGNALEAVVSSLRRKLGARAKALQTVRGAGYRLTALACSSGSLRKASGSREHPAVRSGHDNAPPHRRSQDRGVRGPGRLRHRRRPSAPRSCPSATGSASTARWPTAQPVSAAELADAHRHARALRARVAQQPGRRRLRDLRPGRRRLHAAARARLRARRREQPAGAGRHVPGRRRGGREPRQGRRALRHGRRPRLARAPPRHVPRRRSARSAPTTAPASSPSGCPRWTASWRSSSAARASPTSAAATAPRRS